MTTDQDVLAAVHALRDEAVTAALAPVQAANAALTQQHAADQATIAALQAEIAKLRPTLFGSGIDGWAKAGEPGQHAYTRITTTWAPKVLRLWGHLGSSWSAIGLPAYVDPTLPIFVNLGSGATLVRAVNTGIHDADLTALFGTDPGRRVWVSLGHEPENDGLTPAEWAACQNRVGRLAQQAGGHVHVVPLLMGSTYMPDRYSAVRGNVPWSQWWDGIDTSLVHGLGADCYQWGKQDPGDSAAEVLQPVIDAAKTIGLPVVLGELGARCLLSDAARAQFLADAVQLLTDARADLACYYESDQGALGPWCLLAQDGTAVAPNAAAVWATACQH